MLPLISRRAILNAHSYIDAPSTNFFNAVKRGSKRAESLVVVGGAVSKTLV